MTTATAATTTKAKPAAKPAAKAAAKPAAAKPAVAAAEPKAAVPAAPVLAADASKAIEQAVSAGKETIEQVVKASQEAAATGYDKAVALGKEQVEAATKAQAQAAKSTEEALAAAKENLDAVVQAGQLLSKGLQELSKSVLVLTQEAVEDSVTSTKKLLAAKTLHEAVDLHSAHAKAQIDRLLAEGTRLSDSTLKLFEQALAPIQARLHATVDKLTKLTRH
ncbi:MAG: phasin family protein [Magnetospirillum sp.]|nr:phasin family protein [Magnetospirillum sp.]